MSSSFKLLKERRDAQRASTIPARPASDKLPASPREAAPARTSTTTAALEEVAAGPSVPRQPQRLAGNADIELRHTAERGRGLFYSPRDGRRLGRGTTILRLTPEVTVPSSENLEKLCHTCLLASKDGSPLQRCSGCKLLRYCSLACQKKDWPSHRAECKALQTFQKRAAADGHEAVRDPGMILRLMGRLIWERKRRGEQWWKSIETLQANRQAVSADPALLHHPVRLAQYLDVDDIDKTGGEGTLRDLGFANAGELLDLIGRTNINTFVSYTSDLTSVGAALSTTAAMINHSCSPNTAIVYPNGPGAERPMHVVAIRDVEPDEELTTFYIDVSDPFDLRQRALQQRYSFQCRCPLCKKYERTMKGGSKVDAREAVWCGRLGCSGWVSITDDEYSAPCSSCRQPGILLVADVKAAREEGVKLLAEVERRLGAGDATGALTMASSTMKKLTSIQPPSSYPLLSLLRQLQTALILQAASSEDPRRALTLFEEAIRLHIVSLAGMQAAKGNVFMDGHPSRAIALATLATLMVREVTEEEAGWSAALPSTSVYLSRVPSVPPIGQARDQAGIALMVQAINELKIAYGNEEGGGEPGRKLAGQVREWQEATHAFSMARTPS